MDDTFDRQVTLAWNSWAVDFGGELRKLNRGDSLTISQTTDGTPNKTHPQITFTVTGAHRLRATINEDDLDSTPERFAAQVAYLDELGWRRLNNHTHILEQSARKPRRMAALAGHALRNVWEVMHPAFLDGAVAAPAEPSPVTDTNDPNRLLAMAAEFLSTASGIEVEPSIHRTVALPDTEGIESWIQPTIRSIGLECCARLGLIADPKAIGEILLEYGQRCRDVSLFIDDGYLCAALQIHAPTFDPESFRECLRLWQHFLLFDGREIRGKIAAAASCAHPTDTASVPKLLQHIADRCAAGDGYDGSDVAAECELNEHLILAFLRTCDRLVVETTERAMEALLIDGDRAAGERINTEVDAWVLVSMALQQALRISVMRNREDRLRGAAR